MGSKSTKKEGERFGSDERIRETDCLKVSCNRYNRCR